MPLEWGDEVRPGRCDVDPNVTVTVHITLTALFAGARASKSPTVPTLRTHAAITQTSRKGAGAASI